MANLSKNRSGYVTRSSPSPVTRMLKLLFYGLILIALAGTAWHFWGDRVEILLLQQKPKPTVGYHVIKKEVIAGSDRPDPVNRTPMGYPRRIIQPTRYLLTCRSVPGNEIVIFSVDRWTYEGLPLQTYLPIADVAGWQRNPTGQL